MKKVILYCRVSSLKQSIYGMSLEDQEYRLKEYCNSRGWIIVEIIHEICPAKNFKRKYISKIIKEMKAKTSRFDSILCISFDRFSRDVSTAQDLIPILMNAGIELYTLEKKYNLHSVAGRREYVHDAYRAQDDNMSRAAKAESGIKQQIRNGNAPFRVGPGYKKILGNKHKDPLKRTESQTVFNEKTAHIWREAFSIIASGAFTGEGARKYLNKKYGLKIQKQTFYNVLHNPFYMGYLKYTDEQGIVTLVKGKHPALVSETTWYLVQERLAERSRKGISQKKRNPRYPLRGFLICPDCGEKLTAGGSKSRNGTYFHYYNCQRKNKTCSFNFGIDVAHNLFENVLKGIQFSTSIQKAYLMVLENVFAMDDSTRTNRIKQLEELTNNIKIKHIELVDLLAGKKIEKEEYDLLLSRLKTDRKMYDEELDSLAKIESSYSIYTRTHNHLLKDFNSFFWTAVIDCQYELLDTIIDGSITFEKDKIRNLQFNPNFKLLQKEVKGKDNEKEGSNLQPGID